jgi:hypothetical protein
MEGMTAMHRIIVLDSFFVDLPSICTFVSDLRCALPTSFPPGLMRRRCVSDEFTWSSFLFGLSSNPGALLSPHCAALCKAPSYSSPASSRPVCVHICSCVLTAACCAAAQLRSCVNSLLTDRLVPLQCG